MQTAPAEEELPLLGRWPGEADGSGAHRLERPLNPNSRLAICHGQSLQEWLVEPKRGLQGPVSLAGRGGTGQRTRSMGTAAEETVDHFRSEVSA